MTEQTWEPHRTLLAVRLARKITGSGEVCIRTRGGCSLWEERTGEKLSGWLRIGQVSVPSAELSRTSAYTPLRLLQPLPAIRDSGGAHKRNSQWHVLLPDYYFCRLRMYATTPFTSSAGRAFTAGGVLRRLPSRPWSGRHPTSSLPRRKSGSELSLRACQPHPAPWHMAHFAL